MECSLPPEIKDRVFYLEGNHMHSSIQKVLTLNVSTSDSGKDVRLLRFSKVLNKRMVKCTWLFHFYKT
jgi:hypothetical protein